MRLKDPATLPRGAKRFVAFWLRDLAADFDRRGWKALVPLHFAVCAGIGLAVSVYATKELWTDLQNPIALYAAGLAVNSILLAVSWAGFSRIFETLGDPEFGSWMKRASLDAYYGFYVDFIQLVQMIAVGSMAISLAICLTSLPEIFQRIALGVSVCTSLYAGRWASGCIRIMQELSDHRATFRENASNVRGFSNTTSQSDGRS